MTLTSITSFQDAEGSSRGDIDGGVVDVERADLLGMQLVAQAPQGGGLAAPGLAGEQPHGPVLDEIPQTGVELVE